MSDFWLVYLSSANLIRGRGPSFLSATNFDLKVLSFLKVKLNLLCGPDFNPLGLERKKILSWLGGWPSLLLTANIGVISLTFFFFHSSSIFLLTGSMVSLGMYSLLQWYFRLIFMVFVRSILLVAFLPLCSTLLWTQLRGHGHTVQKFTVLKIYKIMIQ